MAYDPNVRPPQDPNRPVQRGGGGGWAWIVVIIVVVIILWFAFAGGSHKRTMANPPANGTAPGAATSSEQPNSNGQAQITEPAQLAQAKPSDLAGKQVQLQNAKVEDVSESGAFLIDAGGKQVLVVPAAASPAPGSPSGTHANSASVQKGAEVGVQGIVEKLPTEQDAMRRFQLSSDEAARAGKSGIYISASGVTPVQK